MMNSPLPSLHLSITYVVHYMLEAVNRHVVDDIQWSQGLLLRAFMKWKCLGGDIFDLGHLK